MSNVNKYGEWWKDTIAQNIIQKKYMHDDELKVVKEQGFEKGFDMFVKRVSSIFSRKELREKMEKYLREGTFLPAGRTLYAAGCKGKFKASCSNCYIMPSPEDNIESILDTAKEMARIFSYGGGAGINISNLRPKGAAVNNSAKTSSGAVSFMDIYNVIGEVIGNNGRRSAILIALNCTHPDIEEFLKIKQNNTKIQGANISIAFTDSFMRAVEDEDTFTLKYKCQDGEIITKKINAREFFLKFCEAQYDWGEPGALFIDEVRDWNLLSGFEDYKIDVTNPCVTGDTKILTRDGYLPIAELAGKEVEVWNGYEWSKVTPKITGHNQKTLKVTFSNGATVQCTPYHKWVLKDGSRVEAKDLQVGDKLIKCNYPVLVSERQAEDDFKRYYTAGFYCGDGTKDLKQIVLYDKKQSLIDYLDVASFKEHTNKTVCTLNNSYDKCFVPTVNTTLQNRLDYLAGLIDADGTKNSEDGSVTISSIEVDFLNEVRLMLNGLGIPSTVGLMHKAGKRLLPKNNSTDELGEYNCKTSYRLTISGANMEKLLALGLDLKRVKVEPKVNRDAGRFIHVTSIENAETVDTVYCMNEPKNHTFIANGVITGNCAEFAGSAYNSCNLGSINLYNVVEEPFTKNAHVDTFKLSKITRDAVELLDEILDYGYELQPLDANRKCIDDWRSIGLGVFGLADMLVALGIKYGSDESLTVIESVMNTIRDAAFIKSAELGKLKGSFGKFDRNKFEDSAFVKTVLDSFTTQVQSDVCGAMRNGTLLSIAPTGSISMLMRESGGVEPYYQVAYDRTTHILEKEGKSFHIGMLAVEHLLKHNNDPLTMSNEDIKKKYPFVVDTYDIDPLSRIDMQSYMQDYVDNAISSTINLKEDATIEDIFKLYMYAWEAHCKGITIFRDNCKRINILGTDHGVKREDVEEKPKVEKEWIELDKVSKLNSLNPHKRADTKVLSGKTFVYHTSCVPKLYVTVNVKDGDIFEVFVAADKGCQANIATITRLTSYALRLGGKVDDIIKELESALCPACAKLREKDKTISKSCASCIAQALKEMQDYLRGVKKNEGYVKEVAEIVKEVIEKEPSKEVHEGRMKCPECGDYTLIPDGKCAYCNNCGYSKC